MKIDLVPIGRVVPYEGNPRDIPQSAIDAVKQSITDFGWRQPIVVDKDYSVIVGHTRLLAAKALQFTEVPIHVAVDMSEAQVRAYRLADNKSGEFSLWSNEKLSSELAAILESGIDIDALGFTDSPLPVGFEPSLAPNLGSAVGDVTTEQMGRVEDNLASRHADRAQQTLVDVICPHCGEDFMLDPRGLT
jgi:hypothetical protein